MARDSVAFLKAYPDKFLRCQTYRTHALFATKLIAEVPTTGRPPRSHGVVSQCSSCKCYRTDWIDTKTGDILKRWYDPADGYALSTEDGERIPVVVFRQETVRRIVQVKRGR